MGNFLRQMPKNEGTLKRGPVVPDGNRGDHATLAEIGITKKQSATAQKLADIPEPRCQRRNRSRYPSIESQDSTANPGRAKTRAGGASLNPLQFSPPARPKSSRPLHVGTKNPRQDFSRRGTMSATPVKPPGATLDRDVNVEVGCST